MATVQKLADGAPQLQLRHHSVGCGLVGPPRYLHRWWPPVAMFGLRAKVTKTVRLAAHRHFEATPGYILRDPWSPQLAMAGSGSTLSLASSNDSSSDHHESDPKRGQPLTSGGDRVAGCCWRRRQERIYGRRYRGITQAALPRPSNSVFVAKRLGRL